MFSQLQSCVAWPLGPGGVWSLAWTNRLAEVMLCLFLGAGLKQPAALSACLLGGGQGNLWDRGREEAKKPQGERGAHRPPLWRLSQPRWHACEGCPGPSRRDGRSPQEPANNQNRGPDKWPRRAVAAMGGPEGHPPSPSPWSRPTLSSVSPLPDSETCERNII